MENLFIANIPAENWKEALPLGNGKLGAMVFGGTKKEKILLNHEWLWRGKYKFRDVQHNSSILPELQHHFLEGDLFNGSRLANLFFGGSGGAVSNGSASSLLAHSKIPAISEQVDGHYAWDWARGADVKNGRVDAYQPGGYLIIEQTKSTSDSTTPIGYSRQIDLEKGICTVSDSEQQETVFVHYDLPIIAYQIEGTNITANIRLERDLDPECELRWFVQGDRLSMEGNYTEHVQFFITAKVETNGTIQNSSVAYSDGISIKNAQYIRIFLTIATSNESAIPIAACEQQLKTARVGWNSLISAHMTHHSKCYNRVDLGIGNRDDSSKKPIGDRMASLKLGHQSTGLELLYFNYARYLLMACSRPGGLPANLQGIWNGDLNPPWESDFHNDVNIQMSYWFAEQLQLTENIEPLFDYVENLVPHAKQTALKLYNCEGIVFPIQTDPWGRATPESACWAVWTGAAAWLSQHFWWRYEYSGDKVFLKNRTYPLLKEIAAFYSSFVILNSDGYLVTIPSQSPENFFVGGSVPVSICTMSTMDIALIRESISHAIQASKILNVDENERNNWKQLINLLPPYRIGKYGQLQEWLEDYDEGEPGHRHMSHLVTVYPGEDKSILENPSLMQAVETTINRRYEHGGQQEGWPAAWASCLWARLGEGRKALEAVDHTIKGLSQTLLNDFGYGFNIDANHGAAAGMVEMLLQSHGEIIKLLPAISEEWDHGYFEHWAARGGFIVSCKWESCMVTSVIILSKLGGPCRIQAKGLKKFTVICEQEVINAKYEDNSLYFETMSDHSYTIKIFNN